MKAKAWLSWSSGKDSAWALHMMRSQDEYQITGLLTTINSAFDRVAMHSTRRALVEAQAHAAGLPLVAVPLPWPCSNAEYERIMAGICEQAVNEGVSAVVFGDIFLEDIRAYRERQLQNTGLQPLFPLWKIPTRDLAREMIDAGLKAKLVCVDPAKLAPEFVGRDFDRQLLADLPPQVDPCGENGEFHSFVYGGPMFDHEIPIVSGERVKRDGFWFCDLLPAEAGAQLAATEDLGR